jgi:serine/threonine protein kinase
MPRCVRCGDDHPAGSACPARPVPVGVERKRNTSRRMPAVREITRPIPALPPVPGAVVVGRYVLGNLVREDPPGVYLFGAVDRVRQDAAVWVRAYGAPTSTETGAEFVRAWGRVAALQVPGLAPILDVGVDRIAGLFVVEGLGPGPDLATQLEGESLPVLDAVGLAHTLTGTLATLHRAGLAHGGLRPEVVVLGAGGSVDQAVIADVAGRAAQRATGRHAQAGHFTAPEFDPARPPAAAEDVYTIGALLFRLVAGRPPGPDALKRPLSELCPDVPVPQALDEAVRRSLAPDLKARHADIDDLHASLGRAHADMAGPAGGEARPTELGRYTLVKLLARGGMGEVFLARIEGGSTSRVDRADAARLTAKRPRVCVVKRIRGEYAADENVVARFVAEARLAARMVHDNIVSVYDLGRTGEDFFIVMEYVAGKDLRELLQRCRERRSRIPIDIALHVAREVCRGLAYVHGFVVPDLAPAGLVHRDVSPQNILLGYDGRVKLIDFGLARGGLGTPKTSVGVVVGKLCYLSPEQARGQVATPQSDLFAAGLVLWELLTNRPLFDGEPEQVAREVLDPHPQPPSRLRPEVPPEVDRVCMRALAPERVDRYLSAESMAADIERALGDVNPGELALRAGQHVADAFALERRGEEFMARSALTAPPAAPAAAMPVETRGRSLLSESDAMVVADTSVSGRRFDWTALADSLSGQQPLPDTTTQLTRSPWRPSRLVLLLAILGIGLVTAIVVFIAVLRATAN